MAACLDYYRQFEDIDEEEINRELRERRARERAVALERVPVLDLSGTEWPDLPNAEVVNASIYGARARQRLSGPLALGLRNRLAERHGVEPEQMVVGNGAGELLQTAAHLLLAPGRRARDPVALVPAVPADGPARRGAAGGGRLRDGAPDPEAVLAAVTQRTRVVAICEPQRPDRGLWTPPGWPRSLASLPEHVHVLLDEAYAHFQDVEPADAGLRLVERHPRLLVLRTFSKAYGLSGCGAATRSARPRPPVAARGARAGARRQRAHPGRASTQALRLGDGDRSRRRAVGDRGARAAAAALRHSAVEAPASQANFVWLARRGLARRRARPRASARASGAGGAGGPLGDDERVRARSAAARPDRAAAGGAERRPRPPRRPETPPPRPAAPRTGAAAPRSSARRCAARRASAGGRARLPRPRPGDARRARSRCRAGRRSSRSRS